jgi:hypothetical protein
MELIYCNFNAKQNGRTCAIFVFYCWSNSLVNRQTKMDRIRRHQISARPFPRHEKF